MWMSWITEVTRSRKICTINGSFVEFRSSVAMNASLFGYFIITYLRQIIFQGSRPSYKDLAKTKLSSVSLSCVLLMFGPL